jgi:hypothetical protein
MTDDPGLDARTAQQNGSAVDPGQFDTWNDPDPADDGSDREPPPDPDSQPSQYVPPDDRDDQEGAIQAQLRLLRIRAEARRRLDDEERQQGGTPTFREQLLSVSDLSQLPVVQPLVDGLLYRDTLAQLSGPPGSFKSFISVGVSCALAAGQTNWEGHRIPTREHVVYVVAEGASGLNARILAWCERNRVDPERLGGWLHILPVPIQLGILTHVEQMSAAVRDVGAGLLVLDTRARCTVGLDENSATDQGEAIEAADRIRSAADDCTVWPVHHNGRNGLNPRGSNAWDGAVWSDLRLAREDFNATITVEKHKDAPSGRTYDYRLVSHTVSEQLMPNQPEQARNTLVAFSSDGENSTRILTANENSLREIAENSCGTQGLSRSKLVDLAVAAGMSQASAYRAFNALVTRGVLTNIGTEKRQVFVRSGLMLPTGDDE